MADYEKMYALLCGAIDSAIDMLDCIPEAQECEESLKAALLQAVVSTRRSGAT